MLSHIEHRNIIILGKKYYMKKNSKIICKNEICGIYSSILKSVSGSNW
jgi:hypothetical protein